MNYKIGMRNIKTGIAIFLCVLISKFLKLEYPFYAAIAAIISMESSIVNSLKAGKNRILGTLAGALIGFMFALIRPDNALLCGLGIIVLIWLCNYLKWQSSITIAGIVYMAIMLNLNGKSPLTYSVNRIIDTIIGIGVALIVNYLFFPHDHAAKITTAYQDLGTKLRQTVHQTVCRKIDADLKALHGEITHLANQIAIHTAEFKLRKGQPAQMEPFQSGLEVYHDMYDHLKIIQGMKDKPLALSPENAERLSGFFGDNLPNAIGVDEGYIVYNYHVGKIIDCLNQIALSTPSSINTLSNPHPSP